ncbi:MAG TPA: bifunctional nicotinamide-nucleotide adenylyltransferase/Nudix hydroxylase [Polyangiaceae bacterium]|nr:bifunctional nicotinamide-nucleotide adenylyltransferase/Nudix hydroxylase [Polyangiaceae bacterium]
MEQSFDAAILVGRFQPFHAGHARLLERALAVAPRVVIVLGSAFHARTAKNPFTWQERAEMIRDTLALEARARVTFAPVRDWYDDLKWSQAVEEAVLERVSPGSRCALVGCFKDQSSYYLRHFPRWALITVEPLSGLEAQHVRAEWFDATDPQRYLSALDARLPVSVRRFADAFSRTPEFEQLREEHRAIVQSRKTYGRGPFVTVDAVVTVNDRVLLVQRGRAPGKDLWALPGGFLEPEESLVSGALRELREETGLELAESACADVAVFAHPARSLRGRIITHAHYFPLGELPELPVVKGADDAAAAQWLPVSEVADAEQRFFDDHFHVLRRFLKGLN